MRKRTLIGAVATLFGALVALSLVGSASAAPAGAATNLTFGSQVCQPDGTVSGTLKWTPSGVGSQYVDLALDAGFTKLSTGGPFASSVKVVTLTQLQKGTTYYTRVRTESGAVSLASDVLAVTASDCTGGGTGAITAPTNLAAQAVTDGIVNFSWKPGNNNIWFCLDTAKSLSDLLSLGNTWRNHGCWTTASSLTVNDLQCGQIYYWLVYSWNLTSNVKSQPTVVQTASCQTTITPPTNLDTVLLGNGDVLFDWNAGRGNIWFCVDTAKSSSDLISLTGTWQNHGCWTTDSRLVVSGLDCDETYYWLVYSWNFDTNIKSGSATFDTAPCKGSHLEEAPIVDVDVSKVGSTYQADIVAALPNGCHAPDSHRVQRSGNTINITVWNRVVEGPCTFVYSEYELHVNLGSNFIDGQTYKVVVNQDETATFEADN